MVINLRDWRCHRSLAAKLLVPLQNQLFRGMWSVLLWLLLMVFMLIPLQTLVVPFVQVNLGGILHAAVSSAAPLTPHITVPFPGPGSARPPTSRWLSRAGAGRRGW